MNHWPLVMCMAQAGALALLLLGGGAVGAQQATERYIPLGQSPGISGQTGMIGTVVAYREGVLTVASPAYPAPQLVRLGAATQVWLDRSAGGQGNMAGQPADLAPGRRVEVHFADPATRQTAAWVKVEPGGPR